MLDLHYDLTVEGFAIFDGATKIAVVGCTTPGTANDRVHRRKEDGSYESDNNGHPILFPVMRKLPRSKWAVHFTSPSVNLEMLEAIIALIPKGDDFTVQTMPVVPAQAS